MNNPFQNASFAKHTPTYVAAPIEQFAKTAEVLNQRYEQNKDAMDQLDIAMANIKVEDADNPIVKARLAKTKEMFANTLQKGDFENAGSIVKKAYKEHATDPALKAATENYAIRQQTKEELRKRFDSKLLSSTQYQDRIKKFNDYQGIGAPDELGFYNPYTFDMGVNRVDLDDFANKALAHYQPDTKSFSGTGVSYAGGSQEMGIATSQTTSAQQVSSGARGKYVLEAQIQNNPDAMAYIQDEVRIHNENNPDNPITVDKFIDDYTTDYVKRYDRVESSTATAQLREADEFKRNLLMAQAKKNMDGNDESGYGGIESLRYDGQNPYASEALLKHAKGAASMSETGLAPLSYHMQRLSPEQEAQYANLKRSLGSDAAVANYLANANKTGITNTYMSYNSKTMTEQTKYLESNIAQRQIYDPETGVIINGADFAKEVMAKGAKFTAVGRVSANNTYFDLLGGNEEAASFSAPYVADLNGKKYIVGMSQGEISAQAPEAILYNRLTQTYRSGIQSYVNPGDGKMYRVIYRELQGTPVLQVYEGNSNKGIGTIMYSGNSKQVINDFNRVIAPK